MSGLAVALLFLTNAVKKLTLLHEKSSYNCIGFQVAEKAGTA